MNPIHQKLKKINDNLYIFKKNNISIKNAKTPFGIEKRKNCYIIKVKIDDQTFKKINQIETYFSEAMQKKLLSQLAITKYGIYLTVKIPIKNDKIQTIFMHNKSYIVFNEITKGNYLNLDIYCDNIYINQNNIIIKWKAKK